MRGKKECDTIYLGTVGFTMDMPRINLTHVINFLRMCCLEKSFDAEQLHSAKTFAVFALIFHLVLAFASLPYPAE